MQEVSLRDTRTKHGPPRDHRECLTLSAEAIAVKSDTLNFGQQSFGQASDPCVIYMFGFIYISKVVKMSIKIVILSFSNLIKLARAIFIDSDRRYKIS